MIKATSFSFLYFETFDLWESVMLQVKSKTIIHRNVWSWIIQVKYKDCPSIEITVGRVQDRRSWIMINDLIKKHYIYINIFFILKIIKMMESVEQILTIPSSILKTFSFIRFDYTCIFKVHEIISTSNQILRNHFIKLIIFSPSVK